MTDTENAASILDKLRTPSQRAEAFSILTRTYGPSLYWHIRRIVIGHDDAEDVFQDTCVKVLANIATYRGGPSELRSWLYRIATNEAISALRRRTRWLHGIDSLGPALASTLRAESSMPDGEPEMMLQRALLTLPTAQRLAFNMRYFDDMSYEEMERVTHKSRGTLKTNYHYAAEKIKKYIKENS